MSTDSQLKGDSLRRQKQLSEKYALENGLQLVQDEALSDIGISAFKGENAVSGALGRFLEAARTGHIKKGSYLLVESLDRISRQTALAALTQFLDIVKMGVVLVTLNDNKIYKEDGVEFNDLFYSLMVMQRAHEESATKSSRIGAAWQSKRNSVQNKKLTARCPGWLILSQDKTHFSAIEERVAIIARIFSEALSGIGAYTIARRLNRERIPAFVSAGGWHSSSINKILTNRAVLGEFIPHKMVAGKRVPSDLIIADYFPRIIEDDLFHATQAIRIQRRQSSGGRRGEEISNLFSKIAACAYCGEKMHFENKGEAPKGGTYLVCGKALRGLGCESTRWRYDHFETSCLTFVEELDLGSIVVSEEGGAKRLQLETKIKSLKAQHHEKLKERERIFQLVSQAGTSIEFISEKLRSCGEEIEVTLRAIEVSQELLDRETAQIGSYYESKDKIRDLIGSIRKKAGSDTYQVRAQVALRLRAIISELRLAPAGRVPMKDSAAAWVAGQEEDRAELRKLQKAIQAPGGSTGKYFTVALRDGTIRIVYPDSEDPMLFNEQILKTPDQIYPVRIDRPKDPLSN